MHFLHPALLYFTSKLGQVNMNMTRKVIINAGLLFACLRSALLTMFLNASMTKVNSVSLVPCICCWGQEFTNLYLCTCYVANYEMFLIYVCVLVYNFMFVSFEVLTAMCMTPTFFCVVVQYSLVDVAQYFRRPYCLCHQTDLIKAVCSCEIRNSHAVILWLGNLLLVQQTLFYVCMCAECCYVTW